ncbi:MAG: PEP-CTERM sorting domain-containing protein [Moraxellaceae bacterium]|nr:PEP-CTERM sorting domain-containing protein [Moraxellaceae bacterium]
MVLSPVAWLLDRTSLSARITKTVLLGAALLAAFLAATASAAPMYRYTYSGMPYGMAEPYRHTGPWGPEDYVSAQILSPFRLTASDIDIATLPGVQLWLSDGAHTFVPGQHAGPQYELLPQEILDHPELYYDSYPFWPYQDPHPYESSGVSIVLRAFDEQGLPTDWSMHASYAWHGDIRSSNGVVANSHSFLSGTGERIVQDDAYVWAAYIGAYEYALSESTPALWPVSWRLDVIEVPEPGSLALLAAAFIGLGSIRRRRRRVAS